MNWLKRSVAALALVLMTGGSAFAEAPSPQDVLQTWYGLVLRLVRHTPIYSPPVAARAYAYLGVLSYEAVASGSDDMQSLVGQLNGLNSLPKREAGKVYDNAAILDAAMAAFSPMFFSDTGPSGQHAMAALEMKMKEGISAGLPPDVYERSAAYGKAMANAIEDWSKTDGGATVVNMGFPKQYKLRPGREFWVPTNMLALQQHPLLPEWGKNRTFAIPKITDCELKKPVPFSEDKNSEFYKQAKEVYDAGKNLTDDQRELSIFWADDPLLTPTPAGHGISIALQILQTEKTDLEKSVDVLARLGVGQADAMIGAWHGKYIYDRVRPITYIQRNIDPKWDSLVMTPAFPDYPSGHSVQSGSFAVVMNKEFGENYAFEDKTGEKDGLPMRRFASFDDAAKEAGFSRLYGGIHYRAAIENGLEYGKCIGGYTTALKTRK